MPIVYKDLLALLILLIFCITTPLLSPTFHQMYYQFSRFAYQHNQNQFLSTMTMAESSHFTYAYQELSAESLALVQAESEHIFQAVNDFFAYTPAGKIPVIIYPSGAALNERFGWQGERSPMGVYWMGYINILSPDCWISASDDTRAQIFRHMGPMAHEYSHFIIDEKTSGNYPRWFSEGVAQYVEQSLGYFTTTLPSAADRQIIPLSQLDSQFDNPNGQNHAYWQSLAIIHYLTEQYGEAIIAQILDNLCQNADFATSLYRTTGLTEDALLDQLALNLANAVDKFRDYPL